VVLLELAGDLILGSEHDFGGVVMGNVESLIRSICSFSTPLDAVSGTVPWTQ
jgi:hypothetical protein